MCVSWKEPNWSLDEDSLRASSLPSTNSQTSAISMTFLCQIFWMNCFLNDFFCIECYTLFCLWLPKFDISAEKCICSRDRAIFWGCEYELFLPRKASTCTRVISPTAWFEAFLSSSYLLFWRCPKRRSNLFQLFPFLPTLLSSFSFPNVLRTSCCSFPYFPSFHSVPSSSSNSLSYFILFFFQLFVEAVLFQIRNFSSKIFNFQS